MSTRVYLPATLEALASFVAAGQVGPAPLNAHAVTDELRMQWAGGSEEEWEYAALSAAAEACTAGRRVVLAADVEGVRRAPDQDSAEVTAVVLDEPLPMRLVAAVQADLSEADAQAGEELCWFAVQEIPDLLR
ncbi:MAG: DUF6912 family protein [Marmoricola sp.]